MVELMVSSSSSLSSSSSESGEGEIELNDHESHIRDRGKEATIHRATRTVSVTGARQISYDAAQSTVWVLLLPAGADTRARYAQRGVIVTHAAWIAEDPGSELEGARLLYDSRRFLIHGTRDVLERGELWQLDVEELL